MGNYKLVFYGAQESVTHQHELTAYRNQDNNLFITIIGYSEECIAMDIQTAVRFSREIKRVIAEIKEVSNG